MARNDGSNYCNNDDKETAAVFALLEKLKSHFDKLIQCEFVTDKGDPCDCDDDKVVGVNVLICGKDPFFICLVPVKGAIVGVDSEGNDIIIEPNEDGLIDITKCCSGPHVMIPEGEDPEMWLLTNGPTYPAGTNFYTGDDPLNPTAVWEVDVNGQPLCQKALRPVHVQIPEGEDPAAWIAANWVNYPPDSHFYTGDDPLNPTGVWNVDAAGNILCDKTPTPVHVQVPEGEDAATWIAANWTDYPADSHFYTGDDPLNPTGVWNVDAAGNILCDKTPAPIHVQVPEDEDPETWIAANASNYPPGTHFYTGTDPLNPDGVWVTDSAGNVLCDKQAGGVPTHSQTDDIFDPENPPTQPSNPPAIKSEGFTHIEKMKCGICFYTCLNGAWVLDHCCITMDKKLPSYCGLTSAAIDDSLVEPDDVSLVGNDIVMSWSGGDTLTITLHNPDPGRPPIVGGIGFPIFYFTQANPKARYTAVFEHGDDCEVDGCKPIRKLDLQLTDVDFPGTVLSLNDLTGGTLAQVFNNSGALQPTGVVNEWEVQSGFGNTPQFGNGIGYVVDPVDGHLFEGFGTGAPAPGSSSEGVIFFARLFRRDPVAIDSCTGEATDKNGEIVAESDYEVVKGCC